MKTLDITNPDKYFTFQLQEELRYECPLCLYEGPMNNFDMIEEEDKSMIYVICPKCKTKDRLY